METHFLKRHLGTKVVMALLPLDYKGTSEMKITTIAIDLAKIVLQIHSVDECGNVLA